MSVYIADMQLITPLGPSSLINFFAYLTGKNAYQSANYHTPDHHQIILSLVPDGVLPDLVEALEDTELSFRDERLLLLSTLAAEMSLASYQGDAIPLFLAGPQNYPTFCNQLPPQFLQYFSRQVTLPIDYSISRQICTGRTGVIEAIRVARHYLDSGYEYALVGGVDTCHNTEWLDFLDASGRLASERPAARADSFVPGEGVAFLLLTNQPERAMNCNGCRILLTEPGFGEEPGHLYSENPYRGEGLDQAVKDALAATDYSFNTVFSSMNGENYWAKELGVAMTRSSQRFPTLRHEHPADCFGDLGAASGGALIALAAHYATHRYTAGSNCLVCTSSDTEYRSSIGVIPERIPT